MAVPFSVGRWIYRPRPPSGAPGEEPAEFRLRLASALRAGHGIGASFRISIGSGPDPVMWLTPEDLPSVRWATRVFSLAYERYQWRWVRDGGLELSGGGVWDGSRSRSWPEPFRTTADGVSALDASALALGTLPAGARCEWSFEPMSLVHRGWWDVEGLRGAPQPYHADPRMGSRPARISPGEDGGTLPLFWYVRVRVRCAPPTSCVVGSVVTRALESATRSGTGNGLRFRRRRWRESLEGRGFPMAESEVVLALPGPASPAPGGPEPTGVRPPVILPLGRTITGRVVGPPTEPDQGRHLAILGETGMGKSSLLVALSRTVARDSGLLLFDPLGETAYAVRAELPPSLASRVTWIDPGTSWGLNALEGLGVATGEGAARRERRLNDLVYSLRRVRSGRYADSGFWGPRLEEMLTRALSAAAALPDGTLVDAHALLASGGRGFRTVPPQAVDAVRELADRIRSRPEDADGARRLLYEVTRSPILVRMLCDRTPTLRATELVAPGRIVLIAGDAARVGESTARYLLSVYLALAWGELLARPGGAKTFVVLDEAQWFVHESLAEMLRLGRRRNVHVILATQAVASLPDVVAEALWTNVADFVAFRGSPQEAREFARAAPGVPAEATLALPRGEAAVLIGKGNAVHWLRTARVPRARTKVRADVPVPDAFALESPSGMLDSSPTRPSPPLPSLEGSGARVRNVLLALARRIEREGAVTPVRISLTELRREADPTGAAVRTAGGILGRLGAIARTGRDETGPCWWIDPQRVLSVDGPGPLKDEESGSEPPQPS